MREHLYAALTLAPFLTLLCASIYHYNNQIIAEVLTVEDCVTGKWIEWEDIRGAMPTVAEERMLREECWAVMGAELNSK